MDEQQIQACTELIKQLFNCANSEEIEKTLKTNLELVDRGFLEVARAIVVQQLKPAGNEQAADWLMNLVGRLSERIQQSEDNAIDEQRIQARTELIKQLFNCANSEEIEKTLKTNSELVDRGFLEVARAIVVQQLKPAGNEQAADWLMNLVGRLSERIQQSEEVEKEFAVDPVTLQFVREMLQLVVDNGGNPQQVYPFFAANQKQFNLSLLKALPGAFKFAFIRLIDADDIEQQRLVAAAFTSFADLIQQFSSGQRWLNLELAIQAYGLALQIYTRDNFPVDWSIVQSNLANAYSERIHGSRAENLELAIQACERAIQVCTHTEFPIEWAAIQINLASAYSERIRGNRAENLELAIQACEQALQVYTHTNFPLDWAMIQMNLAKVYADRIRGDRAENLELAIQACEQALQVYTCADFSVNWARTQVNLARAYWGRIRGNRAENLELAIQACERAIQVCTHTEFPVEWATIQINLANAYSERIRGNRAENLELAIQACKQALQIYTHTDFPLDWAMTQNKLANIYYDRIHGDRAENLESAIQACEQALRVYTYTELPLQWAMTQNSLANALKDRIRGDRAENLELAIQICKQVQQIYTSNDFPEQWAKTQNLLANAYSNRVRGDHTENPELAIQACEQALQVYTHTDFPMDWAMTQITLAIAYWKRTQGNQAENLELAIQACEQALQVYTRADFPVRWATTQSILALAYWRHIHGDRAENLELAIQACEQALQVYTRADFPVDWAMTQSNLANAYSQRIRGDHAENLELAIQACKQALQVYTHADFPVQWAMTQNNLALVYSERIRGDHAENLNQAIASYHAALRIYQPKAFPLDCLKISRNLGDFHFHEGNWTAAVAAYELALQGVDQARQWAATDDRRQKLQDEAASVYTNLVQSYVHLEHYGKALETVERSRSQRLVHLMASQDYYAQVGISPDLQTLLISYDSLQIQINQLQRQQATLAQTRRRAALSAHSEEIHDLETQKQTLRQQISRLDPVSAGIIQVSPIDLATLQTLIPRPSSALLSFYITNTDTHIFILKQTQITCHTCPNQGDVLRDWLFETWLEPYAKINFADTEHDRSQRRQAWIDQMPDILRELVDRLNLSELIQTHLQAINDLILVPHLLLHQIPFAALPLDTQG